MSKPQTVRKFLARAISSGEQFESFRICKRLLSLSHFEL
jgi:hypothetical protein